MTDRKRQMELGKLTNAVRFAKSWQASYEKLAEKWDNVPEDRRKAIEGDAKNFANIVDILMDYGIDKFGPEFDNAVKD